MSDLLYADSSAIVKRYLHEVDSAEAIAIIKDARTVVTSQITFTEVARALMLAAPEASVMHVWEKDWRGHQVVALDHTVAWHASMLAAEHGIRSLDALHLASALALRGAPLHFATWDRRLHAAARAAGLRVVPAALGEPAS